MPTDVIGIFQDGRKLAKATGAGPGAGVASVDIELPDLRVIDQIIYAGITGGYYLDDGALSVSGNRVTVTPKYVDYPAAAAGPAIAVPAATDLSGETITLIVVGY